MQTFIVDPGSDNKSLVRVILSQYPRLGTGRLYQALRHKDIRINGRRQHVDCRVAAGDEIAIYLSDEQLAGAADKTVIKDIRDTGDIMGARDNLDSQGQQHGQDQDRQQDLYTVIYQDPLIIIVNKRPGVTVHQADGSKPQGPVLLDRIRLDFHEPAIELCHRLDRQTGGLLLLARRPAGLAAVRDLMQSGQLLKRYRCLVRGVPDQGSPITCADGVAMLELTGWLEKDALRSDVYIHDLKNPGDLPIVTRYRVLRIFIAAGPDQEDLSELEVELVTGRTHQIRAHLAHIGHPLLGDGKYGRNSYNRFFSGRGGSLRRQQLFSTTLVFPPQCQGPLAGLAGRTFTIEPDYDWAVPGQDQPAGR